VFGYEPATIVDPDTDSTQVIAQAYDIYVEFPELYDNIPNNFAERPVLTYFTSEEILPQQLDAD